ncbi:hypothetical protein ES703_32559 [subsurface metagenome]
MSQVVGKTYGFGKVFIERELLSDGFSYLCDFDAVCQAGAVMVVKARREDLGFAFKAPECRRVYYSVAVAFEVGAIRMRLLRELSTPAESFTDCVTAKFTTHFL